MALAACDHLLGGKTARPTRLWLLLNCNAPRLMDGLRRHVVSPVRPRTRRRRHNRQAQSEKVSAGGCDATQYFVSSGGLGIHTSPK